MCAPQEFLASLTSLGFTQPLTEMCTRSRKIIFRGSKVRPVRRAVNVTAICEPIVYQLYSRGWVAPFQTHYFSENVVASEIEPGPLDL
jgi:hypothetical protein